MKSYSYTYNCPVCNKKFTYDSNLEPCCTGPSESRDEHEITVMILHKIETTEINPVVAKLRSEGPLLLPDPILLPNYEEKVAREVRLLAPNA